MGWIEFESFGVFCPCFDDEFIGRQTLESFEPAGIVVCVDEVGEMGFELLMAIVVVALDGGFFNRPVHSLDLSVGPRVLDFGQAVFDAVLAASHVKHVRHVGGCRPIRVARREGELDAIVRQNGVDLIGNRRDQGF